jgi:hypothetical protein
VVLASGLKQSKEKVAQVHIFRTYFEDEENLPEEFESLFNSLEPPHVSSVLPPPHSTALSPT